MFGYCGRLVFAFAWIGSFAVSLSAQHMVGLKNGVADAVALSSEPRGAEVRSKADTLRLRMLNWKEQDFRSLFGVPLFRADGQGKSIQPGDGFARLSTEYEVAALPGLRTNGVAKDHTDLYEVSSSAGVEVFFGITGTPVYVSFFLKVDADFVLLRDNSVIDARLAWERPRFDALYREVDTLWRRNVIWEVDRDEQRKYLTGLNSTGPDEVWQAVKEFESRLGYHATTMPETVGVTSLRWYGVNNTIQAEATLREFESRGKPAKNVDVRIHRPDGVEIRETVGSNVYNFIGWLRPDGTYIRSESIPNWNSGIFQYGNNLELCSWYDARGKAVRREIDTNGDNLPDMYWEAGMAEESFIRLSVDKSWIVNSELIPDPYRVPDQNLRRIPIRRIPE
jgi:hypothetical protein